MLEQGPSVCQGALEICGRLPLGDVSDECGQKSALPGLDRAQGDVDGELAPVFALAGEVESDRHGPRAGISQVANPMNHVPCPNRLGQEHLDVVPEQLAACVTEQRFRLRVDQHDSSLSVGDHDCVRGRLELRGKALLAPDMELLGDSALADVAYERNCQHTLLRLDRTERDVHRKLAPVLAPTGKLEPDAHGPRAWISDVPGAMVGVPLAETLR